MPSILIFDFPTEISSQHLQFLDINLKFLGTKIMMITAVAAF